MPQVQTISVIVPCYKCSKTLPALVDRLEKALGNLVDVFEVVLVNDCSPEEDWNIIKTLSEKNLWVKGINLSRNFGQHYAITAGLVYAKYDWVVVMDGDLQDLPEEISKFVAKTQENFDIVLGRRINRQDNLLRRSLSKLFYKVFSYLTETEQDASIANFGIYSKQVVTSILKMNDAIRYFPTMVQWVGYKKCKIDIEHGVRDQGTTSYTFRSLLKLAINNIIAFSDKPLRLTVKFGFILSTIALLFGFFILIRYLYGYIEVSGYASLILSIWFLGGLVIAILGMVGIYIGKVFERVKDRPVFIIRDKINL